MNFGSIDSVIDGILKLMEIPKPPDPPIAPPLILKSFNRPGLSAQEMASEIIRRQAEAGIPVGPLPDGSVNPNELMEIIRMQVLIDFLTTKARISVAIQPGTSVVGTAGTVPVVGSTASPGVGNAIIQ